MVEPRWHLRFANFKSALALLQEALDGLVAGRLSELEREGLIQRFEYTWELGWKAMFDYLVEMGVDIKTAVPANVIRAAHQVGLIQDADLWIEARKARNQMAHEYDRKTFEGVIANIRDRYVHLLAALAGRLEQEHAAGN